MLINLYQIFQSLLFALFSFSSDFIPITFTNFLFVLFIFPLCSSLNCILSPSVVFLVLVTQLLVCSWGHLCLVYSVWWEGRRGSLCNVYQNHHNFSIINVFTPFCLLVLSSWDLKVCNEHVVKEPLFSSQTIDENPAILSLSDCFLKTGMIQFIIVITDRSTITVRSSWWATAARGRAQGRNRGSGWEGYGWPSPLWTAWMMREWKNMDEWRCQPHHSTPTSAFILTPTCAKAHMEKSRIPAP